MSRLKFAATGWCWLISNYPLHLYLTNLCFKVIGRIERTVNKTITLDYGQNGQEKLTEAVDKVQQEVRGEYKGPIERP